MPEKPNYLQRVTIAIMPFCLIGPTIIHDAGLENFSVMPQLQMPCYAGDPLSPAARLRLILIMAVNIAGDGDVKMS